MRIKKTESKKIFALMCVLFLLINFTMPSNSLASSNVFEKPQIQDSTEYAPGQLLLKFDPKADSKDKEALRQELGLKSIKKYSLTGSELVELKNTDKVKEVAARLIKNPLVLYAEPNYKYTPGTAVDDPQFSSLWGLNNTGQTISGVIGTPDIDIDAPEAWDLTQGSSKIVVAVIDQGVDISHPDIAANIWTNPFEVAGDGIDNDGNGFVDDINGWDFYHDDNSVFDVADGDEHGTHVAGTIAAVANNSLGVAGVAPNVKIMPLKFLGPSGGYTSDAIEAITYAQKMGATLASNSWGGDYYSSALHDAILNFSGVFVAAAGNDGQNTDLTPNYPSAYDCPNIIAVAALNNQGELASFSNYGPSTVDIGAPGVNIYSLKPGAGYQYMSGTSMATPHVSGIAALMLSINPSLTPDLISNYLNRSVAPLASLSGKTVSGGMANAYGAVNQVKGSGPYVLSTNPPNKAIGVPLDAQITVTFNEIVQSGDAFGNIQLSDGTANVLISKSLSNDTLTITPVNGLTANTTYQVLIPAGAVKNLAGASMAADYTFGFSSWDTMPPTVTGTNPANNSTGAAIDQPIAVTFSEDVHPGQFFDNITIGGTPINSFKWAIDANILYIQTYSNYQYNTLYQVIIPAGAVTDSSKNLMASDYSFSFTTTQDTIAPSVRMIDPEPGAGGVSLRKLISLSFSEDIRPSLNFGEISLSSNGSSVPINLPNISRDTLTISSVNKLDPNTTYTVSVPAGAIEDLAGNPLASPVLLDFTTGNFEIFELPFPVSEAVMDPDQPIVYMISTSQPSLYALDYTTGKLSTLDLTYNPVSLELGQGQFADEVYVLMGNRIPSPYESPQSLGNIAVVNRFTFTTKVTFPIDTDPYDLVVGRDGSFYVTSASGQWTQFDSYSRSNFTLQAQTGIRQMSFAKMHPTLDRIYTIDTDLSPRDYTAYNIANGVFTDPAYPGGYDSPYHGDYPLNTNFAIDPTGRYLFNGSGTIFTINADKAQDMLYAGSLDSGFSDIAFEPDLSSFYTIPLNQQNQQNINMYNGLDNKLIATAALADTGKFLLEQGSKLVAVIEPYYATTPAYINGIQILDKPDTAPAVISTQPLNGSTGVSVNTPITVNFSEDIAAGSAYESITLTPVSSTAGMAIPISKAINGNTLTLTPASALDYSTDYTVNIPVAALNDLSGNSMAADYSFGFGTEAMPDQIAPTVTETNPADGAINVVRTNPITITLSENVAEGTNFNEITLTRITEPSSPVGISSAIKDNVLTITPVTDVGFGMNYKVTLPAGAIADLAGNTLAADYTFSFTTEQESDVTPPTVISTMPGKDALAVPVNQIVTLTFSENIIAGTAGDYDGITLIDSLTGAQISTQKTISGNVLTLAPSSNLQNSTTYTVTIPAGSIKDLAGNPFAAEYTFSFTTAALQDTAPPKLDSTDPVDGASNVPIDTIIHVNFNEDIQLVNSAGITLKKGPKLINISSSVSNNSLLITPKDLLSYKTIYTLFIPAGAVRDVYGNLSTQDITIKFTTSKR